MACAYFPSLPDADVVEITFTQACGGDVALRLLVDSGFTGQSCFILPDTMADVAHAPVPASNAAGALQGTQKRAVVVCRIPSLGFQVAVIAIMTDTSALALPPGVDGVVGLRFLRLFRR